MKDVTAIPKYIHYCWFGGKPMPERFVRYIETWKKWFPGYEIIKWDETNFSVSEFQYAREAMGNGKMAFVSDVARIYALEKMGGVYFDTDVEVIRSFESILEGEAAVLGTEETDQTIGTGFMAFSPKHPVCQEMLRYYKVHSFLDQDCTLSNTIILAKMIEEMYGLKPENYIQRKNELVIYPKQYFTAFDGKTGRVCATSETYCIHHFSASWQSQSRRIKDNLKRYINRIISKSDT